MFPSFTTDPRRGDCNKILERWVDVLLCWRRTIEEKSRIYQRDHGKWLILCCNSIRFSWSRRCRWFKIYSTIKPAMQGWLERKAICDETNKKENINKLCISSQQEIKCFFYIMVEGDLTKQYQLKKEFFLGSWLPIDRRQIKFWVTSLLGNMRPIVKSIGLKAIISESAAEPPSHTLLNTSRYHIQNI